MSATRVSPDRTRSVVYVVVGLLAGVLYPLAGAVLSAILAVVAKDRTLRIVMAVLAVLWLVFALTFMGWRGDGLGTGG